MICLLGSIRLRFFVITAPSRTVSPTRRDQDDGHAVQISLPDAIPDAVHSRCSLTGFYTRPETTSLPAYVPHTVPSRSPYGRHRPVSAYFLPAQQTAPERYGAYYDVLCATGQGKRAEPCSKNCQESFCAALLPRRDTSRAGSRPPLRGRWPDTRQRLENALLCQGSSAPGGLSPWSPARCPYQSRSPGSLAHRDRTGRQSRAAAR